jgi:acetate kinase
MSDRLVTLNAGSSSVKFALFEAAPTWPRLLAHGQIQGLGAAPTFEAASVGQESRSASIVAATHEDAVRHVLDWIDTHFPDKAIKAVGHRIVHGGLRYAAPVVVDDAILRDLRELEPLAPLHQPHNLAGVEAARSVFPFAPQVACFDTAFHRGHGFVDDAYALPLSYYERGVRRFGFHGLSYEYIARRLREIDPIVACGRVVVAHLGNGASLCAMKDGRSVASTMGFSALEGLPMGTRCGQIDPGLLLYLLEHEGLTTAELGHLLYEQSGLKGLSGLSQDMRTLEASDSAEARNAIAYFVHRIRMEIGALAAVLCGIDALVFTGGIGEHSVRLRAATLSGMDWLGAKLDAEANARGDERICDPQSDVAIYALATDEEATIAMHTIRTAGLSALSAAA